MSNIANNVRRSTATKRDWYDHVVVGAGVAGSALAARLAGKGSKVLVLEATPIKTVPQLMWAQSKFEEVFGSQKSTGHAKLWARGHAEDYNAWARIADEHFWRSDSMEAPFRRAEKRLRAISSTCKVAHSGRFLRACEDVMSAERVGDNLGELATGVGCFKSIRSRTWKQWAREAYLLPAMFASGADGQQLEVCSRARIQRIIMERGRATGVEWDGGSVGAGEVILCAGTHGTPDLLMNSGIGPKAELEARGVDVVRNLPGVGANYHGHLGFSLPYAVGAPFAAGESENESLSKFFFGHEEGTAQRIAGGYMKSDATVQRENLRMAFCQHDRGVHLNVCLAKPRARGQLYHSKGAFQPLDHELDRQTLIDGFRNAQDILEAMGSGSQQGSLRPLRQDAEILDFLRRRCSMVGGGVGTCAMGVGEDSVVDGRLRVHGVPGLRISDASVIPEITVSDANASVVAVAEVAMKLLAEDMASYHRSQYGMPPVEVMQASLTVDEMQASMNA